MLSEFGGPENYLRIRFASQDQLNEWLNYLVHHVPLDASDFNFSADLPVTNLSNMSQAAGLKLASVECCDDALLFKRKPECI